MLRQANKLCYLAKSNYELILYIVSVFIFWPLKTIFIIVFYKKEYPLIGLLEINYSI